MSQTIRVDDVAVSGGEGIADPLLSPLPSAVPVPSAAALPAAALPPPALSLHASEGDIKRLAKLACRCCPSPIFPPPPVPLSSSSSTLSLSLYLLSKTERQKMDRINTEERQKGRKEGESYKKPSSVRFDEFMCSSVVL